MTKPTWDAFEVSGKTSNGLLLRSKWDLTYDTPYGVVVIPKGTETDGASIPKMFWGILGPHGPYFLAAFLHDYAYSKKGQETLGWDRYMADMAFEDAMQKDGVGVIKRLTIVSAVRMAGWLPYKRNRKNG
jgi:hypothetical protein